MNRVAQNINVQVRTFALVKPIVVMDTGNVAMVMMNTVAHVSSWIIWLELKQRLFQQKNRVGVNFTNTFSLSYSSSLSSFFSFSLYLPQRSKPNAEPMNSNVMTMFVCQTARNVIASEIAVMVLMNESAVSILYSTFLFALMDTAPNILKKKKLTKRICF